MRTYRTYDVINAALFGPFGGSRRLRRRLVEALEIEPGHRVVELGCGSGQVTELLVEAGAEVVAVDALEDMLVGARLRAPSATFVLGDLSRVEVGAGYDRVVLSFVLHNFDRAGRTEVLRRSRTLLGPGGGIGILDWDVPGGRVRGPVWRRVLRRLEPSENVREVLDDGLDADVAAADLRIDVRNPVAGQRAQILVAHPSTQIA